MSNLWDEELTTEEEDALLDKIENEIVKRKLQVPAIMFFEMNKPLANIAGHFALATSTFLVPIVGYKNVNDYSRLLSKRDTVEKLIVRLEQSSNNPKNDAKEAPCNT
jgi:hypothetical protein